MNDPERLLTSDVSEREYRLLRAGASEEPPRDGAARLAAALGVAPSSLALPDARSASAPRAASQPPAAQPGSAGTPAASGWAAKWIALSGAGVIAVAGTALFVQRTQVARTTAPAQVSEPASAAGASAVDLAESTPPPAEGAERPQGAAPARANRSIADEIAQLERVRVLLTRREAGGALQLLAAYERDNTHGALREEAHFMRVQALALGGQHADARRSARSFERLYPKSVHSARVRSIAESLGAR